MLTSILANDETRIVFGPCIQLPPSFLMNWPTTPGDKHDKTHRRSVYLIKPARSDGNVHRRAEDACKYTINTIFMIELIQIYRKCSALSINKEISDITITFADGN